MTCHERRCYECGVGIVGPVARKGRYTRYKSLRCVEIPESVAIPTCGKCGAEWIDIKTALEIDAALEVVYQQTLKEPVQGMEAAQIDGLTVYYPRVSSPAIATLNCDLEAVEKAAAQIWDYLSSRAGHRDDGFTVSLRLADKLTHLMRWIEIIRSSVTPDSKLRADDLTIGDIVKISRTKEDPDQNVLSPRRLMTIDEAIKHAEEVSGESDCPCGGEHEQLANWLKSYRSLLEENEKLKAWINDLQSGMYINCVYCGHRYGPHTEIPASMADVLKAHIEECPKHPMSTLKTKLEMALMKIAKLKESNSMSKAIIEKD